MVFDVPPHMTIKYSRGSADGDGSCSCEGKVVRHQVRRCLFPEHLLVHFTSCLFSLEEENGQGDGERPDAVEYDRAVHILWGDRCGRIAESTLPCERNSIERERKIRKEGRRCMRLT